MRKIIVTCAIVERQNKVLITQRSLKMAQPLLWEFPGGKLEEGEKEEEGLVRELWEELRLKIVPVQRLSVLEHVYEDFKVTLIPYICRYSGGTISLMEHLAYEWAQPSDLRSFDWCEADIPVVEEYLQLKE